MVLPGQAFSVLSSATNGTAIAVVQATDNVSVTNYAIVGGNTNGAFSIGSNGLLSVANNTGLATDTPYTLQIQATDAANNTSATETVQVTTVQASSFHVAWTLPAANYVEASVDIEVITEPTVNELYFWALQASFNDGATDVAAGHTGLQYNPSHPNNRAVNWGGYSTATGTVLPGTTSTLPSTPNNDNTRDYQWQQGRTYRYRIFQSPTPNNPTAWRATITDLTTMTETVIRDIYGGGTELTNIIMWSEVFAACNDPQVQVRWTNYQALTDTAQVVVPATGVVSYQPVSQGGCTNTSTTTDATGVLQTTNSVRINNTNDIINLPGTTSQLYPPDYNTTNPYG